MALTIYTSVASLNSQRNLVNNPDALVQQLQRLSSGLRIGSAKDDAAGLAINDGFTAQIRDAAQAMRNANDAISLASTADSALSLTSNMLQRLRKLAVQAANGSNTVTDRTAIQTKATSLQSEINQVATATNFKGRKLLDGSFSGMSFQVGANQGQTISVNMSSSRVNSIGAVAQATSGTVTTNALAANDLTLNGVAVRASSKSDDTKSSTGNSASAIAKAAAINASTSLHGVTATVNSNSATGGAGIATGTLNSTNKLVINGVEIDATVHDATDSDYALRNAINAHQGTTGVTASLNGSNKLVLTAADGRNIDVVTAGTGGMTSGLGASATTTGTITLTSDSAFTVAAGGGTLADIGLSAGSNTVNKAVNVGTIDLTTQAGATAALGTIDQAIRQISTRRASLGTIMNKVSSTLSNLGATDEKLQAARSPIQNVDFASETATFVRNQILANAFTTMSAQANVPGQIAFMLLGAK